MKKEYVIEKIGYGANARYALKQRFANGALNSSLFVSLVLKEVKDFARNNAIEVMAIGDFYQVIK